MVGERMAVDLHAGWIRISKAGQTAAIWRSGPGPARNMVASSCVNIRWSLAITETAGEIYRLLPVGRAFGRSGL